MTHPLRAACSPPREHGPRTGTAGPPVATGLRWMGRARMAGVMLWLACTAAVASATGQVPLPEAERDRIQGQRAALKTRLAAQEAACLQHFRAQRCLDDVRSTYRAEQADLDRQQQLLDAEERKQRGAARLERIRSKTSVGAEERARSARERAQENQARLEEARGRHAAQRPVIPPVPHAGAPAPHEPTSRLRSGLDERAAVQHFNAKQEQARQRQERARKRLEAKEAKGRKAAQPLPTPASAPASR